MDSSRRTPGLGDGQTRTGLAARISKKREDKAPQAMVTTRGTDELLARAREAGIDLTVDEGTLAAVESRLRDV